MILVGVFYARRSILFVQATKLTTAADAIFLQDTAPLYVLLAAPFLLGERVVKADLWFMLALAVGLSFFFVGTEAPLGTAPNPFAGNVAAAASGLTWAGTVIGLRWLGTRSPTARRSSRRFSPARPCRRSSPSGPRCRSPA